jgi:hypothetical protein
MDIAARLEDLYHIILLEKCKTEESKQWEISRHSLMKESIRESCNYYALRNCENEREI